MRHASTIKGSGTMQPHFFVTLLTLFMLLLFVSPVQAGGVVTVCDELHLMAALSGGGTVTFSCSGTIALTSQISIATNTTIDGSGQTVTISGNDAVRVMVVNPGVTLNVNQLAIVDGYNPWEPSSGILNQGTLFVNNTTFSGHESSVGAAIYNSGTLTANNTTFTGNNCGDGGGIYHGGFSLLTVSNSTFSGNTCANGRGTAIYVGGGTAAVSNSSFAGNFGGNGGGIYNLSGSVTIINSTFASNRANNYGTTGEGSGIYNESGTVTLKNSAVANSLEGSNCYGTIIDGGGNLVYGDNTCPGINGDPKLGPLQNNGGPTATMALLTGSAARDAGNDTICAAAPVNNLDQRGAARPQGPHCDIGSYEAQPPCPNFLPPATVGIEDIQAMVARWGWTTSTPGWDPAYDLNGDNKIDIIDIMLVAAAWGSTCP
jgi:hypothetical protein